MEWLGDVMLRVNWCSAVPLCCGWGRRRQWSGWRKQQWVLVAAEELGWWGATASVVWVEAAAVHWLGRWTGCGGGGRRRWWIRLGQREGLRCWG